MFASWSLVWLSILAGANLGTEEGRATPPSRAEYVAPAEFEPQDFIWLTWSENSWLGGPPMSETMLELIRVLAPHVRVRILFSEWSSWLEQAEGGAPRRTLEQARVRLLGILEGAGVDLSRVELMASPMLSGALQDPGPFFLRSPSGAMALTDFRSSHPDPKLSTLDQFLAQELGIETVSSSVVSDGGNRQSNGRGTLLIGEAFERSVNPSLGIEQIEAEHLRVHGASNVIWLQQGPADEEWGRLVNGSWGIGTAGHIDQFARWVDPHTVLLLEVAEEDRARDPMLAETHRRMEQNRAILEAATDQDGKPVRILRLPAAEPLTTQIDYDRLNRFERMWFEEATSGETLTISLPAGYMNFVVANDLVVTAKYWRPGWPDAVRRKDAAAKAALEIAFPGRKVVQIDISPLLHDGAGLHCYVRNQPTASRLGAQ